MRPISRAFLLLFLLASACSDDEYAEPHSARDMVVQLQSFDVLNAGSLESANVYMTRYAPRMDSTAQDSAWLGYLNFVSRFIDAQNGRASEVGPDELENPFADEGLVLVEDSLGVRFDCDAAWQQERFAPLVHDDLADFLRIQVTDHTSGLSETFPQLHRLEYWADHNPQSPLLERITLSYRQHVGDVFAEASAMWQDGADRQKLFDGMQAFPGLDANLLICHFLKDYLVEWNPPASWADLISNLTDTMRYHPRPIDLYAPTE